ncbi:MAG: hypothetical protein JWP36_1138 [Paucimonas sp.]|nr:hypothetical protein [Paucimonas sp.]
MMGAPSKISATAARLLEQMDVLHDIDALLSAIKESEHGGYVSRLAALAMVETEKVRNALDEMWVQMK